MPDTGRGDAGAGNTSAAGNPLELPARKLFYWSIRFAHWDSCRYMGEWTAALQKASGDPDLQTYVRSHPKASNRPSDLTAALLAEQVNWNNFDGRMYLHRQKILLILSPFRSTHSFGGAGTCREL